MDDEDFFFKSIHENKYTFKKYMIVSAQIERVVNDSLHVRLINNRLRGEIRKHDIPELK